jgi:PAS domain-containing protein
VPYCSVPCRASQSVATWRARQLYASKARLQVAIDAAQLGSWQYDPRHRVVSGDTRFKEIFDVIAENGAVVEEIMKRVHPDDAERVWAAFQVALHPADPKPLRE